MCAELVPSAIARLGPEPHLEQASKALVQRSLRQGWKVAVSGC